MLKLLRAGFARLWKDKVFWLCVVWAIGCSVYSIQWMPHADIVGTSLSDKAREGYFDVVLVTWFACAVFVSMFLGKDHAFGTIRNKLVVGHRRVVVYLSNFVFCLVGNLMIMLGWLLGGAFVTFYIGTPSRQFMLELLVIALCTAAFTALLVWLNMAFANRAAMVVISLLLLLGLILPSSRLVSRLDEPASYATDYFVTANGELQVNHSEPNPDYVSGTKRQVYQFIVDALPTGPLLQLASDAQLAGYTVPVAAAVCETVLFTAVGCAVFKKKDLK